jgi:hypothetical protein
MSLAESFDERYAKALVIKKVKQGAKWIATTPLVLQYVWMVDVAPHANEFMANRTLQLKMAAWPNPDWLNRKERDDV